MKIVKHKYEIIGVDEINSFDGNAVVHPQEQIDVLKESIKKYGEISPILVDKDNRIIAGNGRYEAFKQLGFVEIAVLRIENLTERELRQYRIMDNMSSEKRITDEDALMKELAIIKSMSDDDLDNMLMAVGYTEEDIDGILGKISQAEEQLSIDADNIDFGNEEDSKSFDGDDNSDDVDDFRDIEITVKLGDVWSLGKHVLICGDSSDKKIVDALAGQESVDLLITDPYYGVDYGNKNKYLNDIDGGHRIEEDISNDVDDKGFDELLTNILKNVRRIFKNNASYYIFLAIKNDILKKLSDIYADSGYPVRHLLIWAKNNHVFGRSDYNYEHEPIIYGWFDKHTFYGNGEQTTTVLKFDKPTKNKIHQTMKPVDLIENLILNSSKQNDIVADVFGGSGTTLIACENLDRYCKMIELSERNCSLIVDRWEKLTGNKAMLLYNVND